MNNEKVLSIRSLFKEFNDRQILKDVNLDLNKGEVIGIIGSNGSGKTTLLKMIAGLLYPKEGEIIVNNKKVVPGMLGELPTSVGVFIESPSFLPQISGVKNLAILASINDTVGIEDIKKCMKKVGLDPENKQRVDKYSLGMKQRLGIAQAIMENPDLLLFDEPTNALDETGIEQFAGIVTELISNGKSLILVSHNKDDINRFCDKVYRLEQGVLLLDKDGRIKKWDVMLEDLEDLEKIMRLFPYSMVKDRVDNHPIIMIEGNWKNSKLVYNELIENGISVLDIKDISKL